MATIADKIEDEFEESGKIFLALGVFAGVSIVVMEKYGDEQQDPTEINKPDIDFATVTEPISEFRDYVVMILNDFFTKFQEI